MHLSILATMGPMRAGSSDFFKAIYEVSVQQRTIDFNKADFCELLWLTPDEVIQMNARDKCATGLEWLVKNYYLK